MSCEKNANTVSNTAGVQTGINSLQSKFSGVTGRMVGTVTGAIGRSATTALFAIESFDGPKTLDAIIVPTATLMEAGTLLAAMRRAASDDDTVKLGKVALNFEGVKLQLEEEDAPEWVKNFYERRRTQKRGPGGDTEERRYRADKRYEDTSSTESLEKSRPAPKKPSISPDRIADTLRKRTLLALGLLKLGQVSSAFLGTGLARLSRRQRAGIVDGIDQRFFFLQTTRVPVAVWRSNLTPLLNLMDSGSNNVLKSDGIMFELSGKTWHRGTVVIKTAQGERTITHLQSLSAPAAHYYFSRRLDDNEAVGMVSNQKGFDPKHLPDRSGTPATGYAGQISEVESLLPVWASIKRGLIRAHLQWGTVSPQDSNEQSEQRTTEVATPVPFRSPGPSDSVAPVTGGNRHQKSAAGSKEKHSGQTKATAASKPTPRPNNDISQPKVGTDIHPLDNIGPRVQIGDKEYKVMVSRVRPAKTGQPSLAEATYYDDEARVWKEITDPKIREKLAAQVEAGILQPFSEIEAPGKR